MSERSTFIPSKAPSTEPIWPERFLHVIKERDRARAWAVRLEQENAVLRGSLLIPAEVVPDTSGFLDYHEDDAAVWIDHPGREEA